MEHNSQSNDDEPTCVLKMMNEFNRNINVPQIEPFPFVFEKVNGGRQSLSQSSDIIKKRKLGNDSLVESDTSISDSIENVPASPWESNKLRKEIIEYKTQLKNLDYRYTELLELKKTSDLFYEKDRESFKYNEEKNNRKINELEKHLYKIRMRENKLEKELQLLKTSAPETINELSKQCNSFQVQRTLLEDRISQLENELKSQKAENEIIINEFTDKVSSLEEKKELLESTLEKLKADVVEKNVLLQKHEMYKTKLMLAQQKNQELQLENDNNKEMVKQVETLQSKLKHYNDLVQENEALSKQVTHLRQLVSNNILLEGEVEELKLQQVRAQENEIELIKLKTDYASAQEDVKQWVALARIYCPNQEVAKDNLLMVELRDFIEKNQRSILELNYEKKELSTELNIYKSKVTDLNKHLETQKQKEAKAKNLLEAHASTIRRLKKQNNLVTWERNDLRQMVDSFQKEVTLIGSAAFDAPANDDKAKVTVLEKVIEGYRQRMEHIEADQGLVCTVPDQVHTSSTHQNQDVLKIVTERDELLKENERLLKLGNELKEKVEHLNYQMEWRALKGDFDIRETKVLKLRLGPHDNEGLTSNENQIDQLKVENEKLKEKVKILKEKITAGEINQSKIQDITQIAESNVDVTANKKFEELSGKLQSLELQSKRLREFYKTTTQEFRETVYQLFGYKVDRTKEMYKLSSMFAEAPGDNLLFQSTSGQLNLIETEYSKQLKHLMDLYLGQYRSIPMFLSALTQDLFQRQSLSITNTTMSV